ncbi:Protein SSUH2 [Amphibalanus amphitrite]|uniref:Protein SSUH2 n=2 Tax=Amphibalanus amphitrite TaxID=1232801 RepID=A0A6A4V3G3_AMPAM|nr:Protein SSUH2 [Amphibalanus amphitrite]
MDFLKPETAAKLEGRASPTPDEELAEEGSDPSPTAPPIDSMDKLPGYEGLDFTGGGAPPPPPAALPPPPENYGQVNVQHEVPSTERIREIVAGYVAEHCCFGKGPIEDMKIITVTPTPAMKYTLETMTETRITRWNYVPWRGETVPPPSGPPPGPWDVLITLEPSQWFQNLNSVAEVPNTQTVRVCHDCRGLRETRCTRCHGRGYTRCSSCHGRGSRTIHNDRRRCTWCHGRGSRRCITCHTEGMVPCPTCDAQGNIRCFVELTVKWQNHKDIKVVERTDLPDNLIRSVSGQEVFRAEEQRVHPIVGFPDRLVSESSSELVQKHGQQWPQERIFRQRHSVQSVPVFCVTYHYNGKQDDFFIYGNSQKIHFPDYPKQCCCVVM